MNEIDLPLRIQQIYSSCSPQEQAYLQSILRELASYGESPTYRNIWLQDFKEVPVSISQFLSDPEYLGGSTRNGTAVYPFWRKTLQEIFDAGNKYNQIILSGSTRIGKTSTGVNIGAYMLYRLMLYRDPHQYFQKKDVSKFSIIFANLTEQLASGVAYREFNDTLKMSPWFCLVGDTEILTNKGYLPISECCNQEDLLIASMSENKNIEYTLPESVCLTKYVNDTIQITLEDGTTIEGTPDHPVMLSNGTYKQLGELEEGDDIYECTK